MISPGKAWEAISPPTASYFLYIGRTGSLTVIYAPSVFPHCLRTSSFFLNFTCKYILFFSPNYLSFLLLHLDFELYLESTFSNLHYKESHPHFPLTFVEVILDPSGVNSCIWLSSGPPNIHLKSARYHLYHVLNLHLYLGPFLDFLSFSIGVTIYPNASITLF